MVATEPGVTGRRAYSVKEFCAAYSVGRTTLYEEIAAGRLEARKANGKTLIAADAAERWWLTMPKLNTRASNPNEGGGST